MSAQAKLDENAPLEPSLALMQMTTGSWISQAVYVAAKLGIADLLVDGSKSYQELARLAEVEPRALQRILRALASIGVFSEVEAGVFRLTPIAEYLRSDIPGSVRAWATTVGEQWHWRMWGDIFYSVKTGKPSFQKVYGMDPFQYFGQNPEDARLFDQAMTSFSVAEIEGVVGAYDFSTVETLVDVGAGQGSLMAAVLKANPRLKGILIDLPLVAEAAKAMVAREGLGDRCTVVEGDFFNAVPRGGDAYVLKHIVHDWDDEQALGILRCCRNAMTPGARILLVEMVIPPGNAPFFGKLLDLEMLLIGGRERTEGEYGALLAACGFKLTRVTPTKSPVSVVEGICV